MTKSLMRYMTIAGLAIVLAGCAVTAESANDKRLTVGVVQKEITTGMSESQVVEVMGSPNMVTRDSDGTETWIYDKFSTNTAYSEARGGVSALILGGVGSGIGGAAPGLSASRGSSSTSQRTLTVIIKFKEGAVYDFTYRSSSF